MSKTFRYLIIAALLVAVTALFVLYVTTHNIPVLEPKGLIAEKQRDLIIIMSLLMCIVVVPVFIMLVYFAWKYQEHKKSKYSPEFADHALAEAIWWGVPFIIIMIMAVITWRTTHELNPFAPIASENKPLTIQVVALEWKWLFIYPEQGIATINYIQFPKNVPLVFEITADAPMNSFWIPQLGGQIYAMPAMRTKLNLIANHEGSFRGCSSNISGSGFAGMYFQAVATSEDAFASWVESVRNNEQTLSMESYQSLLIPSEYNPVSFYSSVESGLFDAIIMKYMWEPSHAR